MAPPTLAYLVGDASDFAQPAYDKYPYFVFWASDKKYGEVRLIQHYCIEDGIKDVKQAKTKLRNLIRARKDFVRFY